VTAAQVIIYVLNTIAALGSALLLVLGIVGLVSGASVAASAAGTEASQFGAAFGGILGFLSGGLVVLAVISLALVGLWFWIAVALGRGSRAARIVATIFCAIDLAWGLVALVGSLGDGDGVPLLAALLALVVPATLIALLWAAESSRRFFDGVPAVPVQGGPAPMSPPIGFGQPHYGQPQHGQPQHGQPGYGQALWGQQHGQPQWGQQWAAQQWGQQSYGHPQVAQVPEGATAPLRLPAQRCGTCQAEVRPGSASCSGCGAPTTPPRPVGA
jgi:hypothetical protein